MSEGVDYRGFVTPTNADLAAGNAKRHADTLYLDLAKQIEQLTGLVKSLGDRVSKLEYRDDMEDTRRLEQNE